MLIIFLYNLAISCYFFGIKITAVFQPKAQKWVQGRKGIFENLETAFAFQKTKPHPVVWFHCASLGEFEQGRTIIEALKKERPSIKILLTFFSPSGYEIRKNDPLANWVFYLPADSKANARRFVQIVQPSLVVFVKYEFWYHYLTELKNRKIPIFLIAAVFRKDQPFFKWYGKLHREMLACFTTLFVQDENSVSLLSSIGIRNVIQAGDPRIDRVLDITEQGQQFPEITQFCGGSPVLVAGSTWSKDEELLHDLANHPTFKGWKMIVAPHDVSPKRVERLSALFNDRSVLHSQLDEEGASKDILIIDSIGKLAWLYRFGQVAYIGGGFGDGIHNTLEPMAFHLPVIYGPRFAKFVEAVTMVKNGGHFPVRTSEDLITKIASLQNPLELGHAQKAVRNFMEQNQSASRTITEQLLLYFRVVM